MHALRTITLAIVAVLALASTAAAQSTNAPQLQVPSVLKTGQSVSIGYSNPSMAGQTVVIEVDNGMRNETRTVSIEIHLDENGRGAASWTVPSWFGANFNAPGAAERHAPIL